MTKKTINVGSSPGNRGDGDTLRNAFLKTQSNFDELYTVYPVTDTRLVDHSNPSVDGSIAKALADAGAAGGGTVLVGPGTFICGSRTLSVPRKVVLRGINRYSTILNIIGAQDGITLAESSSGIEYLMLQMPKFSAGDGIKVTTELAHLNDLIISGGGVNSWAINLDGVNFCDMRNIVMGTILGGPEVLTSNGIIFQNTNWAAKPWNFGDSTLSSIYIFLASSNTTGIKLHGPDNSENRINNVMLSKVDIVGPCGVTGNGCIGVHLRNAARNVLVNVDIECMSTAIVEESAGSGSNVSSNNVFIAVYALEVGSSYISSGIVNNRLFLGCDNVTPGFVNKNDVVVPRALWLGNGVARISEIGGTIRMDNGSDNRGLQISIGTSNPQIQPSSTDNSAQLSLGRIGTLGVECMPGMILPLQTFAIPNPKDGTLGYFSAVVVGPSSGLYQFRNGSWIFIG